MGREKPLSRKGAARIFDAHIHLLCGARIVMVLELLTMAANAAHPYLFRSTVC